MGKFQHYKEPSIGNIKGGFVFITARKQDILMLNKDVLIVDCSNQEFGDDFLDAGKSYKPSGIVVLMFCKLKSKRNNSGYTWGSH